MARFSERIGVKPPKTVLQLDSMDDDLRNGLWNTCYDVVFKEFLWEYFRTHDNEVIDKLWRHFFKGRVDEIPYSGREVVAELKAYFFKVNWDGV
jgi:hypothetical protein